MHTDKSGYIKLSILYTAVVMIFYAGNALADMRIGYGNFIETFIDLKDDKGLLLNRTYNSQCDYNGSFGLGWGSDYDTHLKWEGAKLVMVIHGCDITQEYMISPDSTVKLMRLKLQPKDLPRVIANEPKRLKNVKLTFIKEYIKHNDLPKTIIASSRGYITNDEKYTFDGKGRLIKLGDISISYDVGNKLRVIEYNLLDISLTFSRPDSRTLLVKYSKMPDLTLRYYFDESGDLRSAWNAWGNEYVYDYNEQHRLNFLTWPDKTNINFIYDTKKNWVMMYRDRDNCVEQYTYKLSDNDTTVTTEIIKLCPDSATPTNHSVFILRYKDRTRSQLASVEELIDKTNKSFNRKTKSYDEQGRNTNMRINKKSDLIKDESMIVLKKTSLYLSESNSKTGQIAKVFILSQGGLLDTLKTQKGILSKYALKCESKDLSDDWKGFYELHEQFAVANDSTELKAEQSDGIALKNGKLAAIKYKGNLYELNIEPKTSVIRLSGKGIGKNRSLREIISTAPQKVTEEVSAALDYGGRRQLVVTMFE